MNDQQILMLYGLKGTVVASREIAKCGLRAAHDVSQGDCSDRMRYYFEGYIRGRVLQIQSLQYVLNELDTIIQEAEDAEE